MDVPDKSGQGKDTETILNSVFTSIQDGIIVINRDFSISRVNPVVERWFSKHSPLAGKKCFRCIHETEVPCNPCPTKRTFETGQTSRQIKPGRPESGIKWVEISAYPISDPDSGEVTQVVELIRDISDHVKHEEQLQLAKAEAESANRAKSEFLANMSHEIRTPMNSILGFTELVMESGLPASQKANLEIVRERGRDLLAIISDILDLARIEADRLDLSAEPFNLRQVFREIIESIRIRAKKKSLRLTCRIEPEVSDFLVGDKLRLKQILLNLVGNAIKFTNAGEIQVEVDLGENLPEYPGTEYLHFVVKDTGIGIEPSLHERIFEPFTQGDTSQTRKYGGTGLGLTITRRLIQKMQGKIWVQSEVGKGSEFHFFAKLFPGQGDERTHSGKDVSFQIDGKPLRILVVDDDYSSRLLISTILRNGGHRILGVENGKEALAALKDDDFDLVLMDIQMPGMNGFEATAAIREFIAARNRNENTSMALPIIAMTAYSMKGDRERCLQAGMDGYISKPIDHSDLLLNISEALKMR